MTGRRLYLLALAGLTLLHVVVAALLPVSGDEAYYWDCSRHLDWCYFDQPPLVIWAMVPFRAILGETALAVRAPAILASLVVGLSLLPLARRLGGGPRHAAGAYLLLHAMPAFLLGSSYASTDVGMTAAYVAAAASAVALAQGERRAWWGFGLAIGLGFLAKFPAVLVLPALLPTLLRRDGGRRFSALRDWRPWLAAALAFALTAPVWLWASRHHWDNLRFQLAGRHELHGPTLKYLGEFLAANLLLASPPILLALLLAGWRRWREGDPAFRALLLAAASPLAFFSLVALRTRVGAHWGFPGLVLATVALALTPFPWRRRLLVSGAAFGLLLGLAVAGVALAPEPLLGLEMSYDRRRDLSTGQLAVLVGNPEIVAAVRARVAPGELVASESYSTAHLLAFWTDGELATRLAHVKGGKHGLASLYWYPLDALRGRDVLFVTEKQRVDERLRRVFAEVQEEEPLEVVRDGRVVRRVRFLRCRELRSPEGVFTRLGVAPGTGFGPPDSGYCADDR